MSGKIILNLAMSLDGYIAREDGGYDWITGDGDPALNSVDSYDFEAFLAGIDVVLMGGESYRQGFAKDYPTKTVYVATSKEEENTEHLRFIRGDIVSIIQREKETGKKIYLFGGGKVIDPFIKADAIDEYNIAIIPIILGSGRKLFLENNPTLEMHLDAYHVSEGILAMTYSKR